MPYEHINLPTEPGDNQSDFHLNWGSSDAGANAQVSAGIPVRLLREALREFDEENSQLEGTALESREDSKLFFYSPNLTRSELNQGIKTLRRMRNAVYGADE